MIKWTEETIEEFEKTKQSLAARLLSFDLRLRLLPQPLADLSNSSRTVHGIHLVIFSRKLSAAEDNYSLYDRELLAVFTSIKNIEYMIEGREFLSLLHGLYMLCGVCFLNKSLIYLQGLEYLLQTLEFPYL